MTPDSVKESEESFSVEYRGNPIVFFAMPGKGWRYQCPLKCCTAWHWDRNRKRSEASHCVGGKRSLSRLSPLSNVHATKAAHGTSTLQTESPQMRESSDSVKVSEEAQQFIGSLQQMAVAYGSCRPTMEPRTLESLRQAHTALAEYIASLEADRRILNELETLADMGSLHMTEGRIHLFRPSLGLWELFDTLREAADVALTTQQAGEETNHERHSTRAL